MSDPHLRAADADRAVVATTLGEAMADGRLTVAEYDERLARTYAARTYGELAELTTDLPPAARPAAASPTAAVPARHPVHAGVGCGGWGGLHGRGPWSGWASTAVTVLAVWLVTSIAAGTLLYFWPFWVIVPWGGVLLARTLGGAVRPAGTRAGEPRVTGGTTGTV